jgi:hypothetical protein
LAGRISHHPAAGQCRLDFGLFEDHAPSAAGKLPSYAHLGERDVSAAP